MHAGLNHPGFAMTADGEAADPTAFLAALVEDPTRAAVVQADPELAEITQKQDVGRLQVILKAIFKEEQAKAERRAARLGERSIDAQRASATVPRDTVQLYAQLAETGLQYGPAFRLLRNVHVPDTTPGSASA